MSRRYCQECMETRENVTERNCYICGAPLVDPPPPPSASGNGPGQAPSLLERIELLNELLLRQAGVAEGDGDGFGELDQMMAQALFEQLGLGGEGGVGGGQTKGCPEEVIAKLTRCVLHKTSSHLLSVQISAKAKTADRDQERKAPLKMDAIPGDFSVVPPDNTSYDVLLADPLTGGPFTNVDKMKGKVIIMQRGVTSFGKMVVSAQATGTVGVIVLNHVAVWPYLMKDTKKEATGAGIWIMIVSNARGQRLLELLQSEDGKNGVEISLSVSSMENECLICQEVFVEGANLIRLPCAHAYHEDCVLKWLKVQHTCPACRHELPTSAYGKMAIPGLRTLEEEAARRMFL